MIRVKMFDFFHEHDLEIKVNEFLQKIKDAKVIDIKYQVAVMPSGLEQIYCFSCMVIYELL